MAWGCHTQGLSHGGYLKGLGFTVQGGNAGTERKWNLL